MGVRRLVLSLGFKLACWGETARSFPPQGLGVSNPARVRCRIRNRRGPFHQDGGVHHLACLAHAFPSSYALIFSGGPTV